MPIQVKIGNGNPINLTESLPQLATVLGGISGGPVIGRAL